MAHRTVLITGASRGIGRACARRFARHGDRVVIVDVDDEEGRSAEEEIKSNGGDALFIHGDVAERLHIHNVIARTLDAYGRIDILINNAVAHADANFLEFTEDDYDRVLATNLKAPFFMSQAVAKQIVAQMEAEDNPAEPLGAQGYAIINISSVMAITATAGQSAYSISKGGLNQLTKALAVALSPYGVRVNAVGPGSINTDIDRGYLQDEKARKRVLARTPLRRIGDPEEVVSAVFFLASPEAGYVTGQCLYVDGGRLALNYTNQGDRDPAT
ncbi:MAG: SDR family NAD(P)-dependent oxidoreductase [Pseudomonadota bacterium]